MRRRITATIGLGAACWSSLALALGLGDIDVRSGLNQPFSASIPVLAVSAEELDNLQVTLADAGEFERLGIERADYLSHLRFEVRSGASPLIEVQGVRPAREPFLTFLLDVRSGASRILREYTVLLDPPTLATAGLAAADTERAAAAASATATSTADPVSAPVAPSAPRATFVPLPPGTVVSTPTPQATPAPTPTPTPRPTSVVAGGDSSRYGPVSPKETLWSIADALSQQMEGVTPNQLQLGLYRANPDAFDRGRIDGLMKGRTLEVPSREVLLSTSSLEATVTLRALRQQTAVAAAPSATTTPRSVATPMPVVTPTPAPTPVPTQAAAAPAPDTDPSAGMPDTAVTTVAGDGAAAPSEGVTEAPMAAQPSDLESTDVVADAEATRAERVAEMLSTPTPTVAPTVAPKPVAPTPAPAPSLLETLKWPLLGLLLLVLLAVALVIRRRRQAEPERRAPSVPAAAAATAAVSAATAPIRSEAAAAADEAEAAVMAAYANASSERAKADPAKDRVPDFDATQVFDAPLAPGAGKPIPETSDFEATAQFDVDTVQIDLNAQDPVAEADIHLAYGLYDEAALTLVSALEKSPDDGTLHAKLAEVYFTAGRPLEFVEAAEAARPHVSETDWQKLVLFGQQIAPESPLFADAGNAVAALDTDLDLAFGDADQAAPTAAPEPDHLGEVDFDLNAAPASEPPTVASGDGTDTPAAAPGDNVLDFQLDDIDAASLDVPAPTLDAAPEASPHATLEFNLDDFDLSAPPAAAPSDESPAVDGNTLDLSLPDVAAEPQPTEGETPAELTLPELPVDGGEQQPDTAAPAALDPTAPLELDLAEFDLGVDTVAPAGDAVAAPEADATIEEFQLDDFELEPDSDAISAGDEAGTKLDLARAYVDMGDNEMARVLLEEVLGQGSEAQQTEARNLIARLG